MQQNFDEAPSPRDNSTSAPNCTSTPRDYIAIDHQHTQTARAPLPLLPNPQLQSAPDATLLPISTTLSNSTPHKRKAALTGLQQPIYGNVSAGKRRHANAVAAVRKIKTNNFTAALIEHELDGAQHTCLDFVNRFLFDTSRSTVCAEETLGAIIAAFNRVESGAGAGAGAGAEATITHGIRCRKFNQSHLYVCYPPTYTNKGYPEWFCRFANAIQQHTSPSLTSSGSSSCSCSTNAKLEWRVTKNKPLIGTHNNDIRPDFVLTWPGVPLEWRSVLVIGEHESIGSTTRDSFTQLASYAEQVFLAQPFRIFVLGILTSNVGPKLAFWRFDRSGAIGSVPLNYSTSNLDLLTVVSALSSIPQMNARRMGFHVDSISWDDKHAYPLDHKSNITIKMFKPILGNLSVTVDPSSEVVVSLKKLVFLAPGIVTRGTRIWTGALSSGEAIAIKYSWSNTKRALEGDLYKLAAQKRVTGVATILSCTIYENILTHLHAGGSHTADSNFTQAQSYKIHIQRQNRILSRLVLSPTGRSLLDPTLSPLQVAEGLLAGLIGHASLFFQGGILHRDISPNNIIVIDDDLPQLASVPSPVGTSDPFAWIWPGDTPLRGCLIDLDHAIEASVQPSGALGRAGTYPFIAIQILGGQERHRYRHDLESLLYVLLWVCCYPAVAAAANMISSAHPIWPVSDPLSQWRDGDELSVINHKVACVIDSSRKFGLLLERFRPGFEHFKRVAAEMRVTLWRLPGRSNRCGLSEEGRPNVLGATSEGGNSKNQEGSAPPGEEDEEEEEREWLLPEEVRLGVSNKQAFQEVKEAMQRLVTALKN